MQAIESVEQLELALSEPTPIAIEAMRMLSGDVLILGVGGKMGPTLARMARRASDLSGVPRRVIGVSRFSTPGLEAALQAHGVETVSCDLLDHAQLARLPDAANVVLMTGRKFGCTGGEPLTWATNVLLPAAACRRFQGSRMVAFSTGNVYAMAPVSSEGSRETDPLNGVGEYAASAIGRERVLEYSSGELDLPLIILRLNYAHELRYGVMVDLALQVSKERPVDVTMGYFNAIWQRDASAIALAAFAHAAVPPRVVNVAGPETLSVRQVCREFAELLNVPVTFLGKEAADALLSNAGEWGKLFGPPGTTASQMIEGIAAWIRRGGQTLGKATHFESRDGRF